MPNTINSQSLVNFPMPISIEDALAMGYKRSDIVYRLIGNRRYSCILVQGTQAQADDYLRAVRAEQKAEDREGRCLISNGKGGYIVCPECNRCCSCPKVGSLDFETNRPLSLEKLMEGDSDEDNTMDVAGNIEVERDVLAMLTLAELLTYLETFKDKKYAEIFQGLFDMKTIEEIAEETGLSWSTCRDHVKKVRNLAQAFTGLTR